MNASKTNRWEEIAEQKVNEAIADIKFYVSEGMKTEKAIENFLKNTTLGKKYRQEVLADF